VLIVDDDAIARTALAIVLQSAGYAVSEAADGHEAIIRLRADGPHGVVLLDLMMPRMDGWQFLDARRHDPNLARSPVVLVTAVGAIHIAAVRALGADDVMQKPVEPEQLLEAVRRYCPAPNP
jgi:chemotaxis family two-component system sensor histidine kinase/response regulator PixL